ncbi:serine/arginine-rich splicing factor [Wolffia australiana]
MEEEKAAAYYDELARRGSGAAKFKQGLGFSSSSSSSSSSSLGARAAGLINFVRSSGPGVTEEIQKKSRIESIQNKLRKNSRGSRDRSTSRSRSRSRERERYSGKGGNSRGSRDRSRSRSRERERYSVTCGNSRGSCGDRRRRSRSRSEERRSSRRSSRADEREESCYRRGDAKGIYREAHGRDGLKNKDSQPDYSQLIDGYSRMTPAERVKAKMKLQLSETAKRDLSKAVTTGWERFDFDKDAPLDDEELEVAEDDKSLVKDIGQSFRLTAVETRREEELKAAHDQAMFGTSSSPLELPDESTPPLTKKVEETAQVNAPSLMSEKILASRGSWRDRIRRLQPGPG